MDAFTTNTFTIENTGTQMINMDEIFDILPPNFTYVPGSFTGLITGDPTITDAGNDQDELKWGGVQIGDQSLDSGEINTFTF